MPDEEVEPPTPEVLRDDERTWAVLAHLGGVVLVVVFPLIIRATAGKTSAFVKDQATEALNFQLTVLIAALVSLFLWVILIGILMSLVVGIASLVFIILAAMQAHAGIRYRYPITTRPVQ